MGGLGGDALGGVHGDGMSELHMVMEVVVTEDSPGAVAEAAGGDARVLAVVVNFHYSPALPVPHRRLRQDLGAILRLVDGDAGVVTSADDHIPGGDVVTAACGHRRGVTPSRGTLGDNTVVDPAIQGIAHLSGVGQQQRIFPRGEISLVGGQSINGHGDLIPTGHPIVVAIPSDGAAYRRGSSVTHGEGGGAFGRILLAPHLGEALRPGQFVAELGEHSAPGFDRLELVGVADHHGFGSRSGGRGEELPPVVGADHAGFIHHDHIKRAELQASVGEAGQGAVHGVALAGRAFGDGDIDGFSSRGDHDHPRLLSAFDDGAQRAHGGGLPRAGRRAQRHHQLRCGGDRRHHLMLLLRQPQGGGGVFRAHPGHRPHIGGVDQVEHAAFLGQDHVHGVALGAFTLMRRARRGQPHPHRIDGGFDQLARHARRAPRSTRAGVGEQGQLRADDLNEIRARQRRLIGAGGHRRHGTPIYRHTGAGDPGRGGARRVFARGAGLTLRRTRQHQTARVGAPLRAQLSPRQRLGFTRPGGLLRGRQLRLRQLRRGADNGQIVRCPLPQLGRSLRPRGNVFRVDPGDLRHPRGGVDRPPLNTGQPVQFIAQGRLINDPRRPGFVEQTRAVNGHQPPISAGLPVRHQHMGVQVRITRPRGLMLVGRRHQTWQFLKVFFSRHRVVHPGVASMRRQVFERLGDRGLVRRGHGFVDDVIAEHPHQRHRLRGAKRQIKPVHPALAVSTPALPRRRHTLIQPARHHIRISIPTAALAVTQPNQLRSHPSIPGARPHRGTGVTFGVILRQPTISPLTVFHRIAHRPRSAVVVVHRPPRQLRHRQHAKPPIIGTRPPEPAGAGEPDGRGIASFAQLVQMCQWI
ncbi:Uncharacterised protein [Mycobacteroides abscessus subsp. abscessus]|nr:Uncharacterised protein [Mycobacteroides abscessus subsp. abscessus]